MLYYASSRDIFALDVNTGIRTHITCLPFWARCTAAGYGYICVGGGDSGHWAVVTLNHTHGISDPDTLGWQARRPPHVQVEQAGQEIVNSISIHKLGGDVEAGTLDEVVAVITNNDKTIRIFSLTSHTQNCVLELPFAVNHATISPSGRILVAVGDYQQAYFYERVDHDVSLSSKSYNYASAHSAWELMNIVGLHVPRAITATGYFTTAWSPSGTLCAVASECGYVSVIDMDALQTLDDAEDAIVVVMPSTRPENAHPNGAIPGAIRTMIFAPPPWDLLIWAEDQGKVCLADLRTGLRDRQILKLDPDHKDYKRVDMEINAAETYSRRTDQEAEREFNRNFRTYMTSSNEAGESQFDIDHDLAIAEARTLTGNRSIVDIAHEALSRPSEERRRERELIDSLRPSAQQQAEARDSASPMPRSIHYSELANDARRSTAQQSSLFAQDFPALARQNGEAESSQDRRLPSTLRAVRDYMRDGYQQEAYIRSTLRPFALTSRDQDLDEALASTATSANNEPQAPTLSDRTTIEGVGATSTYPIPSTSVGSTASRAAAARAWVRSSRTNLTTAGPLPTPTSDEISTHRRRALLRARDRAINNALTSSNLPGSNVPTSTNTASPEALRYHGRMSGYSSRGDYYDPSMGVRTAGLAMARDGRRLWAACDKGIFEFEVDVRGRMGWASLEMK